MKQSIMLNGSRIVDDNRINLDGYSCGSRSILSRRRKINRHSSLGRTKNARNSTDQILID
ncbi:hypothetical protein AB3F22_04130 [Actinomyces johnsonii]|uniref:hypothetical protein n=1 Tax=Actinomyces johnsonii TaxID=544581 RepID=UPI000402FD2B|nr:hypothetical protein [Actinomyces johnsonii]